MEKHKKLNRIILNNKKEPILKTTQSNKNKNNISQTRNFTKKKTIIFVKPTKTQIHRGFIFTKLKNKILNHIMINGNKGTSEKLLINSFKELQKESKKESKKLLQLAMINLISTYKLIIKKNKKKKKKRKQKILEIPIFIRKLDIRNSLILKRLLIHVNKKKLHIFKTNFKQEILNSAANFAENEIQIKNNETLEKIKQIIKKKKYFLKRFRW